MAGASKYLIVNADDFGQSFGVNRGIAEAHEHGVVTSASLMVRWPAAQAAADYSRQNPSLSLGIHIDLGEWMYREENWVPAYQVVPVDDPGAVEKEIERQITTFRQLVGRYPTHIDSHQHVHLREPARSILVEAACDLNVPLRQCNSLIRYCGEFYGQTGEGDPLPDNISVEALSTMLSTLKPGFTELGCHPGFPMDLDTTYCNERIVEVKVLSDPQIRARINVLGLQLCSFNDLMMEFH